MKTPHFGMNPDHCKAGNFEAGCQRWNIPTYCIQYCTDCCWKEIWWKNWNTRYDFPFRQNAAKFGERIETPDTIFPSDRMLQNLVKALKHQIQFSLQTECCKICWKHWNTRHSFPFRQNAAKFAERIETPDTIFPSDRMLHRQILTQHAGAVGFYRPT